MKFAGATNLHRKSGGSPHNRFKLSVKLNPIGAAEPFN
jgi:hypothetical protein